MAATHRITVSLSQKQSDQLSRLANVFEITKSEVVRLVLDQYLKDDADNAVSKLSNKGSLMLEARSKVLDDKLNVEASKMILDFKNKEVIGFDRKCDE